MKKVFLRLLVAGVILAIIVVVLLNTIFKADASIETHNEIAKSLSTKGQITQLSEMLDDDEVKTQFPNMVVVLTNEIASLKGLYTKIIATEQNSDKKTDLMLKSLKALERSLEEANAKLNNLKTTQADGNLKKKLVQDLKEYLNDSMVNLKNLNQSLIEYLIDYYYKNSYDTIIALSYIKVALAQNLITTNSDVDMQKYKKVTTTLNNAKTIAYLSSDKDFNTMLFNCKKVNLYKILTDENYISTLETVLAEKATQIKNCVNLKVLA